VIYTFETRLAVDAEIEATLAANAAHWSFGLRTLWSLLYRQRLSEKEAYRRIRELGFTSKQTGSILIAAQMRKAGLVELKKYERGQLELSIAKRKNAIQAKYKKIRSLEARERKLCGIRGRYAPKPDSNPQKVYRDALGALRGVRDELSFCRNWIAQKERVLSVKKATLQRLIEDMAADRYSLCFGSKDLLRQRPGVCSTEESAFQSLDEWQRTWECARNGQWCSGGLWDMRSCRVATRRSSGSLRRRAFGSA
jgi:hypothetical protein